MTSSRHDRMEQQQHGEQPGRQRGKAQIVNYTMRLGLLLLQFWDRLPEPGDPHRGPPLVQLVGLSSVLLLQHAPLHKHRDIAKAHAVDKGPHEHPLLAQVPGEEVQPPPPELLAEVVRVARVPPQAVLKGWYSWLAQLLQFVIHGHELVQLGVGEVSDNNSSNAGGGRHDIPDTPRLVA